jgi:predicted NAD/FAD-binding protein
VHLLQSAGTLTQLTMLTFSINAAPARLAFQELSGLTGLQSLSLEYIESRAPAALQALVGHHHCQQHPDAQAELQQLPKVRHIVKQTSAGMSTHAHAILGLCLLQANRSSDLVGWVASCLMSLSLAP